jgi:TIR domain
MSGIFLSYRRVDTKESAGRLFEQLRRRFGPNQVFMDVKGGIARGADFEVVLEKALAECDALIALVGPDWLTCRRTDGRRRLDVAEDWVCREIIAALERKIPVVPLLLRGAQIPAKADLPQSLALFPVHQAAEIREESFEYDLGQLVDDLKRQTRLRDVGELYDPGRGAGLLRDLINGMPSASAHLTESAHAAKLARESLEELKLYKSIHDRLHHIEFEVQRPLQAAYNLQQPVDVNYTGSISRIRRDYKQFMGEMIIATEGRELPFTRQNFIDDLKSINDAFSAAGDKPEREAFESLIQELNGLLYYSRQLEGALSNVNEHIGLDDIANAAEKVDNIIRVGGSVERFELGSAIVEFTTSVQILRDRQQELDRRVRQHKQFQDLDNRLRLICTAELFRPAKEWKKIKDLRAQLIAPLPDLWEERELEGTASKIDSAVSNGDDADARRLIQEYFEDVSRVFFYVDSQLKDYIGKIKEINPVLNTLLNF